MTKDSKMVFLGSPWAASSSSSVSFRGAVLVLCVLILNGPEVCNGGETSSFVRKVEKADDMPLDSDVFRVPPGYNAPQQVPTFLASIPKPLVSVRWPFYFVVWFYKRLSDSVCSFVRVQSSGVLLSPLSCAWSALPRCTFYVHSCEEEDRCLPRKAQNDPG